MNDGCQLFSRLPHPRRRPSWIQMISTNAIVLANTVQLYLLCCNYAAFPGPHYSPLGIGHCPVKVLNNPEERPYGGWPLLWPRTLGELSGDIQYHTAAVWARQEVTPLSPSVSLLAPRAITANDAWVPDTQNDAWTKIISGEERTVMY